MKKRINPVVVVCILIAIVAVLGFVTTLILRQIPTRKKMDLTEYYGQTGDSEAVLIVGTQILEQRAVMSGDQPYLPIDVVNTYLNQRYYWDEEGQQILYATPSELVYTPASAEAGGEVWLKDGTAYLSLDFIKRYTDMDTYVYQQPNRVAIQKDFSGVNAVTVKKDTYVRYRGGIKSEVLTKVNKGDTLILMEELENWDQVATWDGYIGYIEKKSISEVQTLNLDRAAVGEEYTYLTMDQPVNMVWHQVMSTDANAGLADSIQNMTGVNVISPTWFYVSDNSGNIVNNATADYVSLAHERGLKVWGLVDNFTQDISTYEVLSRTSSRQNLITQLVSAAVNAGIDGINVDFEQLSEDVGIHFLEFLRELSIECHKNNLILSVDNPVPEDFTSHYDRAEQGRVVDYVIIMGYDEHYVGSEEAGSVASLPWVEQGVIDTIAEVPAQRVINAVPFYTRLWKTEAGSLSSEAIGMDTAQEVVNTNNAQVYWDSDVSQNYGSFEKEGCTYQIWIEDSQSIAAKVQLVPKYNLAGVAAWKLGFENSGIWQVITDNLSGSAGQ
nr:glycosyl hydrolase family 18 protein [uncultured Blautia sp.]